MALHWLLLLDQSYEIPAISRIFRPSHHPVKYAKHLYNYMLYTHASQHIDQILLISNTKYMPCPGDTVNIQDKYVYMH